VYIRYNTIAGAEVYIVTSDPHPWFLGVPFFWSRRSLRGTELPYIDIA
jgi:hypothetical protein